MGEIVKQVSIAAPVERVFEYVADVHNAPSYISSILAITSGPKGVGAPGQMWRADANFLGQRRTVDLRLDRVVQNRLVVFTMLGDPEATLSLQLAPEAGGKATGVALSLEAASVPTFLLNVVLGGMLGEDMQRLKGIMER